MGLSEDIVAALRERYQSGATFAELGKDAGVSLSYLHDLTIGKRDPMKLSLDFFLRLFPSARIELAPACAPSVYPADVVPRSDYQNLRERYQDLRDKYQDLREQYLDLKSRPPYVRDERPVHPYRAEPEPSTSSSSNK